jgi:hypothetical protein
MYEYHLQNFYYIILNLQIIEGLDQGHLSPLLETDMSRPGIERWEASTLAKSYSNSFLITIQNIYMRPPQYNFIR